MTPILTRFLLILVLPLVLLTGVRSSGPPSGDGTNPDTAPAAAPENDICATDNTVFQAGEKVVYKIYYNWNFVWLPAGEVTFLVHDLPEQYHVMIRGRTYESYEWFYQVRDNYESYIDKKTLLPRIHIKDIHEGGYQKYDRTTFDQENHTITSMRGKTRDELKAKHMAVDECMHDLISIVYYARNLNYADMALNEEIPIKILMDQEIHPLSLKYLGREERTKVKGVGHFRTRKFSPQLIAGEVFKEGDEMKIYVSDDDNKLPVLIESPVTVGSVKAVLKSHKGLKFPLTAQLD